MAARCVLLYFSPRRARRLPPARGLGIHDFDTSRFPGGLSRRKSAWPCSVVSLVVFFVFVFFLSDYKTPVEAVIPLPPHSQLPAPQLPLPDPEVPGPRVTSRGRRPPGRPLPTTTLPAWHGRPRRPGPGSSEGHRGLPSLGRGEGRAETPGAGAEGATVRGVEARVEPGLRWRRTQGEGRRGASLGDPGWN